MRHTHPRDGAKALAPQTAPGRLSLERAASLLALATFAVAQPLLDVIANSPEFFVARNTAPWQALATVAIVCLGPLLLVPLEMALRRMSRVAATVFHTILLAALAGAWALVWLKRTERVDAPWDLAATLAVAAVVAASYLRWAGIRLFLTILAPASLIVPAAFFMDASVRRALWPVGGAMRSYTAARTPPIVFVVFDELPLNSLLDGRRDIDRERFPHFARLAREATWFRNAGTVSSQTVWAVPALLSGKYPITPHSVPNLRYYPQNLFTLLGGRYEITTFMPFRQLCPPGVCRGDPENPGDTVRALLADLSVVWLHIAVPDRFAEDLPPVTENWTGFARGRERSRARRLNARAAEFRRFVKAIDGRPAHLFYLHSLLPHWPLSYVQSGRLYSGRSYTRVKEGGEDLLLKASPEYADALHQRHLAQVGFVDRLLGELLARLDATGTYDSTLLVVTADHGASYREGTRLRADGAKNFWDIIHVPLFIKMPRQRAGQTSDHIVESVDVLPTIVDALSVAGPVEVDGHSLQDTDRVRRSTRTFIQRGRARAVRRELPDLTAASQVSLDRKLRRFGEGSWRGLYAPPDTLGLLDRPQSALPIRTATDARIQVRRPAAFDNVNPTGDALPLHVWGEIVGPLKPPVTLAVLLNGTVAAVTRSFMRGEEHAFDTLVPEERIRSGRNELQVAILDDGARVRSTAQAR
jgi:hypothetical protein